MSIIASLGEVYRLSSEIETRGNPIPILPFTIPAIKKIKAVKKIKLFLKSLL